QRRLSQLDRAQRERTDFLVGVAHDMRSPLAGIIGFARILEELDSVAADPMAGEAVKFIAAESQRLSDLVSQLVDLGRVDLGETSLDVEPLDLSGVVSQVVESARARFPAHRFAVKADEPVLIEADLLRLNRIVANLVENAAVHGPTGGPAAVEVRQDDDEAVIAVSDRGTGVASADRERIFERFVVGLVAVEVRQDDDEAVIAVSDRGTGVASADRERIFERFVRLDGNHPGTG